MDLAGWQERWREHRIGFHLDAVNPWLLEHAPRVLPPRSRVLVPLCGKSRDLRWLAQAGHQVIGVEGSEVALEEFHRESGRVPERSRRGEFEVLESEGITLLRGDFFALDPSAVGPVDCFWDRAALIAVDPPRRAEYLAHLQRLLLPHGRGLLIALEYDPAQMRGPPYSLADGELESLCRPHFDLRLLGAEDALPGNPQFRSRGLTWLRESAYGLTLLPRTDAESGA